MTRRIRTMIFRYICLNFRSPARILELAFWPVMELLVWGFFSVYLQSRLPAGNGRLISALLSGLIFWDILYRCQQSVSLALMEELWTRNVMNLLISPLRTWEWICAVYFYGLIKTGIVAGILIALAVALYSLDLSMLGFHIVPFLLNLILMGWGMGLFTSGLLLRWGYAAEAIIWGIPFLIQPFSAIFYPLSVYPGWLRRFCLLLPSTHVMEGMRQAVIQGAFSWNSFWLALGMNLLYLPLCAWFYQRMLERGRNNGQLVRLAS